MNFSVLLFVTALITVCLTACSEPAVINNGKDANINTVRKSEVLRPFFCTIMDNPSEFVGKTVEVEAVLLVAPRTGSYLYHYSCIDNNKLVDFQLEIEPDDALLNYLTPENPEFARVGAMRVIGEFTGELAQNSKDDTPSSFKYRFVISGSANVKPAPSSLAYPWTSK